MQGLCLPMKKAGGGFHPRAEEREEKKHIPEDKNGRLDGNYPATCRKAPLKGYIRR